MRKRHILHRNLLQRSLVVAAVSTFLALSFVFPACNVFSPFHSSGSSDNVDDLVSDAYEALDEENYEKAMTIMDKAMRIAPNDTRVRYLHAVAAVKVRDIDLLDIVEIFQPASNGDLPFDEQNERLFLLSGAELGNLYDAFRIVRIDLKPLAEQIARSGRELSKIRESDDVLMSYGIAETLSGMLRVLDNDDTEQEFSLDERVVIEKSGDAYEITIDDALLAPAERDQIVDEALTRAWHHFTAGRRAFYCYYEFVINETICTEMINDPPAPLPRVIDEGSAVGSMVQFVDDGVRALYDEKEDL